ncbi:Chitotriosidase-1 [Blattella germanica]|nr:Chitotriosidase-1 [Blattella germanica]
MDNKLQWTIQLAWKLETVIMAIVGSFILFSSILVLCYGTANAASIHKAANGASICYWGSWSTYRQGIANFEVNNIDPKLCTHIVYAYTGLKNGVIASLDEYNDYEDNWGKGNMKKFVNFANNNGIKALVGIGGYNEGSTKYSQMVSTAAHREDFANSVVTFTQRFGFHGLALDWEYPTQRGGVPADKENYVLLLQTLKEKFASRGLVLTVGVGIDPTVVAQAYDFANIGKYVDYIIAFTYDYHTYTEGHTAVSAPLEAVDKSLSQWIEAGVPSEKMIMAIEAYGRTYHLADANKHDLGDPTTGPGSAGQVTQDPGLLAYFEYCTNPNWNVVHSTDGSYVYAYNTVYSEWINFEDADTVTKKTQYVKEKGLGGIMFYSLESEDFEGNCGYSYPILSAINTGLGRL